MAKMRIVVGSIGACTGLASMSLGYFNNVEPSLWLGLAAFLIGVSGVYFARDKRRGS